MNRLPHRLEIRCNPANPAFYLACCGLFDLLARLDPEAKGHWRATAPTAFLLDTRVAEADFLTTLLDTFCTPARWRYEPPRHGTAPATIHVAFVPPGGPEELVVPLDWWFETVTLRGEVNAKSAWKMYAGQQTVAGITGDMITEGGKLRTLGRLPGTLTDLLACEVDMSGRFGLDPRSSRNALDVGYSPNDLGLPVKTAPFMELLATFGLASFFPGRGGHARKLSSSRGWLDRKKTEDTKGPAHEPGFLYALWPDPLPILLARRAACRVTPGVPTLFAVRATRKNYSNLTLAQIAPANLN